MNKDDEEIVSSAIKLVEDNVPAELRQAALKVALDSLWSNDLKMVEAGIQSAVELIKKLEVPHPYKEITFDYLYRSFWSKNNQAKAK